MYHRRHRAVDRFFFICEGDFQHDCILHCNSSLLHCGNCKRPQPMSEVETCENIFVYALSSPQCSLMPPANTPVQKLQLRYYTHENVIS